MSPLIDDFRGADGEVVWGWQLIQRLRWTDDDPLIEPSTSRSTSSTMTISTSTHCAPSAI